MMPIYEIGWLGVELFFVLSGFVFTHLYLSEISQRRIRAHEFVVRRLSRLYPLALATLLVVTALQLAYVFRTGVTFVCQTFDVQHFLLHLALASDWHPAATFSFNGPVWSVSIEVLLYAAFFVLALFARRPLVIAAVMVAAGVLLFGYAYLHARGLLGFGTGVASHILFSVARRGPRKRQLVLVFALLLVTIIGFSLSIVRPRFDNALGPIAAIDVMFGATVTAVALLEHSRLASFAWLGNISYAVYLWHFPLQLLLVNGILMLGLSTSIFYRSELLGIYFVLLLVVSLVSYHALELPAQRWLRKKILP